MAKLNSYRELLVWQKSMNLADRCYRMTRREPFPLPPSPYVF